MHQEALSSKLADRIVHHYQKIPFKDGTQQRQKRCLVALAGGPGSGKSTIAAAVAEKVSKKHVKCQVVSIEGFIKDKHDLSEEQKSKMGSFETFDGDKVLNMFKTLRENGPGHELRAPSLDEEKWESIKNDQLIEADTESVIFEGAYILADRKPWTEIEKLVDEKWYVHVDKDLVRERVAKRRVDKGTAKDKEEAYEKYDSFDGKNNDFIDQNRYHTDLIIQSNEDMAIRWPDGTEEK